MANEANANITVRPALPTDLDRILEIERDSSNAAHWQRADYERALTGTTPRRILLTAEIGAQPAGFLVARAPHASEWEIENVVVAQSARRHGLGTALLKAFLEQLAREQSPNAYLSIHLEVRESNLVARQLYEKSGFHLDNRRRAYYSHPTEDAILYRYIYQ
jgi:[ribosomal protein S18]-alanine N-acetyltransferase